MLEEELGSRKFPRLIPILILPRSDSHTGVERRYGGLKERFSQPSKWRDKSCEEGQTLPARHLYRILSPSTLPSVRPRNRKSRGGSPVTNFDIHPPAGKGKHRHGGTRRRKVVIVLTRFCGCAGAEFSTYLPRRSPRVPLVPPLPFRCPPGSRDRAGLDRVGREG